MKSHLYPLVVLLMAPMAAVSQVNSGSNGSDGAFNPTVDTVIDMTDHADGIYQYTSVNVPAGISVTFAQNQSNSPVTWLVQGNCVIDGNISVSGEDGQNSGEGGASGPGGYSGGHGGSAPGAGKGPGGGSGGVGGIWPDPGFYDSASAGSFGTSGGGSSPGPLYGNTFLVPLVGGSGGGGTSSTGGGGGGGGAILIAASGIIEINGSVRAVGGNAWGSNWTDGTSTKSGCGSGGAIRLVATTVQGTGEIDANGGTGPNQAAYFGGGAGRIRIDTYDFEFSGQIRSPFSKGFQPIIIPPSGQGATLRISSVAGQLVPISPSGVLTTPDVVISGQQANPVPIVVQCENLPLNSLITVNVKPSDSASLSVQTSNTNGSTASSFATTNFNLPRGGGLIWAQAIVSLPANASSTANTGSSQLLSYSETGLTADGERLLKMEILSVLGGKQKVTYLSESGKRFPVSLP